MRITTRWVGMNEFAADVRAAEGHSRTVVERAVYAATQKGRSILMRYLSAPTVDKGFWGKGSPPGPMIGVRSGTLRRSVTPVVVFKLGNAVVGVVEVGGKQMEALETGATIRAEGGRYFRIPTAAAQTASGVDRNAGRSMKGVPGTFIFTSRTGNLWIAARAGAKTAAWGGKVPALTGGVAKLAGGGLVLLYLLRDSVKMPEKRTMQFVTAELILAIEPITEDAMRPVVRVMRAS